MNRRYWSEMLQAGRVRRLTWCAVLGTCGLVAVSCVDDAAPAASPPPIAGLLVPQVARVGQPVRLDASATALASAGPALDRFVWTVADGSAAVETAVPQHSHTFAATGSYAVRVQVLDRAGRSSAATGRVEVVSDFAAACSAADTAACAVGACVDGSCAELACAATPACAPVLVGQQASCVDGACVPLLQ